MGRFDTLGSLVSAHRVGRPPPPWRVRERRPPMGGRRASPPGVWPFYWCFIIIITIITVRKGNNVGMLLFLATERLNSQKLKLMRSCKVNKQYFYQHQGGMWSSSLFALSLSYKKVKYTEIYIIFAEQVTSFKTLHETEETQSNPNFVLILSKTHRRMNSTFKRNK